MRTFKRIVYGFSNNRKPPLKKDIVNTWNKYAPIYTKYDAGTQSFYLTLI